MRRQRFNQVSFWIKLGPEPGAFVDEKIVERSILVRIWRQLPSHIMFQKVWKSIEFSWFSCENVSFYLVKLMFFVFRSHRGSQMITWNSAGQKKRWKTLRFWYIFLAARAVACKVELRSRRFVCTGSEFFPKHSVSSRREASFQLQKIRGGPPHGRGRSGHICSWAKRVHLESAKEFGISVKAL